MAGLRYEHASFDYYANGYYMKEQSRTFDNIFPSLSMTAQIGKVQGLVSYTAKIRRPNYSELNGNMSYANRFTLQVGNPFLKPSIIHNISLQAMWKIWSLSADYTDTRNDIIDWT
jgi:outer membrane receptor protein involved in Fe transport